jgi:putative membrane protein
VSVLPLDASRRVSTLSATGEEPDPRFTLANERTFLAWTRTSLALLAAGLAITEFLRSQPRGVRLAVGVPLILLAAAISTGSFGRWVSVERALRLGRPLPYSPFPRVLGPAIAVVAIVASVLLLVRF